MTRTKCITLGLTVALSYLGCGGSTPGNGAIEYVTACGMRIADDIYAPEKPALNDMEQRAIRYGAITCDQLRGTTMRVMNAVCWRDSSNQGVCGQTQCAGFNAELDPHGKIVLGRCDMPYHQLRLGAYAHELFHLSRCNLFNNQDEYNHVGWGSKDEVAELKWVDIVPETGLTINQTINLINQEEK
jgi:hypothetical protein